MSIDASTSNAGRSPRKTRRPLPRERLRLWLRLLRASRGIEAELRERLRKEFGLTLPQFDVLAALARREHGLTMTELSRYLMVSNGNVTGIVDRLVDDGLVERLPAPEDRRATLVRMTREGRSYFTGVAAVHEQWVNTLLDCYDAAETASLISRLDLAVGRFRKSAPSPGGGPSGLPEKAVSGDDRGGKP